MPILPDPNAGATVVGPRHTYDTTEGRRVIDMHTNIGNYTPQATPLLVLTRNLRKRLPAKQPIFYWMDDDIVPRNVTINNVGGYTNADLTFQLAGGEASYVLPNDILYFGGETMLVSSVNTTTDQITVAGRAWGLPEDSSAVAVAIPDGSVLRIIGNAEAEDADGVKGAISRNVNVGYNYCQIVEHHVKMTRRQIDGELYGPGDRNYQRSKKSAEHAIEIEKMHWWGQRRGSQSGNPNRTTTGGMYQYIQTNVYDSQNNPISQADFIDYVRQLARQNTVADGGMRTLIGITGSTLLSLINMWQLPIVRVDPSEKTWGLEVYKVKTPFMRLSLLWHPLFDDEGEQGTAFFINTNWIFYRYFVNADTKWFYDIQLRRGANQVYDDALISDVGLMPMMEKLHGYIKNLAI